MKVFAIIFKLINNLFLVPLTFLLILITSCISNKLQISEFDFVYKGTQYHIRSAYNFNNSKSCNYLLNDNFVAVDLDLDRVIDKVIKGDIQFYEAQEIYEYCLDQLGKKGMINEINKKNNEFVFVDPYYKFSIKTLSEKRIFLTNLLFII